MRSHFAFHCLAEVHRRGKCINPKRTAEGIFTNWTNLCHQHPSQETEHLGAPSSLLVNFFLPLMGARPLASIIRGLGLQRHGILSSTLPCLVSLTQQREFHPWHWPLCFHSTSSQTSENCLKGSLTLRWRGSMPEFVIRSRSRKGPEDLCFQQIPRWCCWSRDRTLWTTDVQYSYFSLHFPDQLWGWKSIKGLLATSSSDLRIFFTKSCPYWSVEIFT